jgi:hypothetical protein
MMAIPVDFIIAGTCLVTVLAAAVWKRIVR